MDTMYDDMLRETIKEESQPGVSEPPEKKETPESDADALASTAVEHKPHKVLPHLAGRRMYSNQPASEEDVKERPDGVEERKRSPRPSPVPGTVCENERCVEKPKAQGGLKLDSVPRPTVWKDENTVRGINYISKAQSGTPVLPPGALTRHTSVDEGNSIPRLFRTSLHNILSDGSPFYVSTGFPFGALVQPFAELGEFEAPVPQPAGEALRCTRCGAYVNPGFAFLESGTTFRCNICEASSTAPFDPASHEGAERPELRVGTCEFVAGAGLSGKWVAGHSLLLVIECTANALENGKI